MAGRWQQVLWRFSSVPASNRPCPNYSFLIATHKLPSDKRASLDSLACGNADDVFEVI
jgi:hypothetical protein